MSEAPAPVHRLYHHFSELPHSLRVLYTAVLLVLGLGYVFALTYVFVAQAGKDGKPGLSYDDIVIAYSGTGQGSRLESALRGPMQNMLPADEIGPIVSWVRAGADQATYEKVIRPTMDKRCISCHDGSNPHLPNLNGYDNLKKATEQDSGASISTLVRVSHIHLFGLSFIFFIVGLIFSHAYMRPVWFKCAVVAAPFVAIVLDVSSWYFTKLYHPFAILVMGGGAVMGGSFAFMWIASMYQMWIAKIPAAILHRESGGVG